MAADLHKLAAGREHYYTREIAKNREEYLSGHGESPGVFHGGSAQALGLEGECSPEAFKRLFAWQDPRTGEQLGRAPRADAMPAWDLVFRPHKDVSVLYALGDQRTGAAVAEAHQAGVRAAVAYLDQQVGTRTGRHGAEHVQGEGLLAVGFTHRTSRAGDPLLHTHLIITNRTRGPDGAWRTLDSRDLLNHRATADVMYRAAYQSELTRSLGVRWEAPDRWGNRAITGMPEELRRSFSKRHEQIAAELERQEASGKHRTAKLVQHVVHATRPPKSHETPETLYGRWQQEARALGYEPERLVRDVTKVTRERELAGTAGHDGASADAPGGTVGQPEHSGGTLVGQPEHSGGTLAGLSERTIHMMFDRLAGPEGLTEQSSTFARREVLGAVGRELPAEVVGMVGPAGLERLADRFLEERAVSVMADHAVGERRYATPELLEVERRLIDAAVSRADEQTGVCSHDSVRAAFAASSTIGADQAAMVRDIIQGGQGVSVVVGKAGTGKTYALGVARHAWQLEGLRVVGAAPTGIATVCLDAEGFEHSRTVDALLAELDQERGGHRRAQASRRQRELSLNSLLHKAVSGATRFPKALVRDSMGQPVRAISGFVQQAVNSLFHKAVSGATRFPKALVRDSMGQPVRAISGFVKQAVKRQAAGRDRGQDGEDERAFDARTVLVVDEAGMLGSRKLARLLDHAQDAGAKVVLVGDDKQLASIEAGGGFRGLRLRLGAATLTENRRQAQPWEREAVEQLREGNVDQSLDAYRQHGRMVATETPSQLKEAMLADWWRSFQDGRRVVMLAYRRDEVDRFNTACQQLRDQEGHLGAQRLQVRDRSFAVGDQVVCGKNALKTLGVANASRGHVVALDAEQRQMTLRLEDDNTVVLPREYLDERPPWWLRGNPDRRTIDLAYATTGHKAQGITRDEVLVRVTSAENRQWLYVAGSRGVGKTTFYSVVTPEPAVRSDQERAALDVPAADRTPKDQDDQLSMVARRDGSKRLAADTTATLDLRSMSKRDLRVRRDQLAELLAAAPPDQARRLDQATTRREQHDQRLAQATSRLEQARDQLAGLQHGPARWLRRGDLDRAREQAKQAEEAERVARQQADRAADRERAARQAQQQHQAHREANPELLAEYQAVVREDKWRGRADARAVELLQPEWSRDLGERPTTVKGGRAWDRAVEQTAEYRQRWNINDAEHPVGREPHGRDVSLEQRQAWRHATQALDRLRDLADDRAQRSERRDHPKATGRTDHQAERDDDQQATGRHPSDHRAGRPDRGGPHGRDHDHERAM